MNILLVGWNRLGKVMKKNVNHELFRRELARQHNVEFFGEGYKGYDSNSNIFDSAKGKDILLTHYEHREKKLPRGLHKVKDVLKAHICGGDYDITSFRQYHNHLYKMSYDIIFARYSLQLERFGKNGISGNHYLFPWSVDTTIFHKQDRMKIIDVMCSSHTNSTHPNRHRMRAIIYNMKNIKIYMPPIYFGGYIRTCNESKIFVTSNVYEGELTGKYTEVLSCGTFLLTTRPTDLEILGYRDGEHLVLYKDDFSDLKDKINYFLTHEKEREEIALNGMQLVRKNHSHKKRAEEFTRVLENEIH